MFAATAGEGGNLITVYTVYGAVCIGLTVWLAVVLFRNGKVFLEGMFEDNPDMGDAINRLLVVGFFMLNLGYAFLIFQAKATATTEEAVGFLVNRLGLLLVSLGLIHFVNMAVFWKIRRRTQMGELPPPVPPQVILGPMPRPPSPGNPPPAPQPRPTAPDSDRYDWDDKRVPAGVTAAAPGGADDYPNLPPPAAAGRDPWAQARAAMR